MNSVAAESACALQCDIRFAIDTLWPAILLLVGVELVPELVPAW